MVRRVYSVKPNEESQVIHIPNAQERYLWLVGLAFLATGVLQLGLVLERLMDAYWQVEKFKGYGSDGYITLGWETGILYMSLATTAAIGSLVLFIYYRKRRVGLAKLYFASSALFLFGLAVYVPLAFSSWTRRLQKSTNGGATRH